MIRSALRLYVGFPRNALVAASFVCASAAIDASACPVQIAPDAGREWIDAGQRAQASLRSGSSQGVSCRSIEVRVEKDTAHLVLTTTDGRRAERDLREPFELAPSIEALMIRFDVAALPQRDDAPAEVPDVAEPRTRATIAADPSTSARVELGAGAGMRAGNGLVAPTLGAFAALRSPGWELGVFGDWEISYLRLDHPKGPEWTASGLGAGVSIGRRQPLFSSLDLLAGARFAGAVIHQEGPHQRPEPEANDAEGRVGAYVGACWPRRARYRLRTEVGADYVPVGSSRTPITAGAPVLPNWSASIAIGIETDGS